MSSKDSYNIQELVNQYSDRLLRLTMAIVNNYAIAEDVLQDAWINIYKNLENFRGESSIYTWMARITVNLAKNRVRPNFWNRLTAWKDEYSELIADSGATAEQVTIEEEQNTALFNSLKELPYNYRAVLFLHYYEDLSVAEIASLLNISISAVKLRLMRGRDKLKVILEAQGVTDYE